jgi:hypothetical protein
VRRVAGAVADVVFDAGGEAQRGIGLGHEESVIKAGSGVGLVTLRRSSARRRRAHLSG